MSVRIYVQTIYTAELPTWTGDAYRRMNQAMAQVYKKVLHPDTVVETGFLPRSTYYTSHSYLELLNNSEMVRGIIRAEERGFDVAFVRCGNDPAVYQAREAVNFPVVGMTESAMHLACQLGARFALIGVEAKCAPLVERNLRLYGLEGRAIARRPFRLPHGPNWDAYVAEGPMWFESMDYVKEKVIPAFEQVARECIEDGAEVICTACGLFSCLTLADYHQVSGTQVPVIEAVAVGIKTAEMLGELKRTLGISTSKHLTYQSLLSPQTRDALAAPFFPEKL